MQVRKFNIETDYEDITTWWKKQDWDIIPSSLLGVNGFIVEKDNKKIAATWIYKLQDSPWSLMEWTVGNPDTNWEDRSQAIKMVTDSACEWAKNNGAKLVFTMTKNERFMNKLQESGFIKTDSNMTHFVRSL